MFIFFCINNFVFIDYFDLKLGLGLNVFIGEIGAGKFIILDVINVILGVKIDCCIIRIGIR